jgi:hypothetical protein
MNRPGWANDYTIMEMMEEDEHQEGGAPPSNGTCFLVTMGILLVIGYFLKLLG